jgi:hypothetical protein
VPSATHGNNLSQTFDVPLPIESQRNSDFLACLTQAIDASSVGRKVIVADAGLTEAALSKTLSGMQGVPGSLLDHLPLATKFDLMKRWGRPDGIEVREIETSEINGQMVDAAREILRIADLVSRRGR